METYLKNRFRYLLFIVACVLCSAVLHCSGDDSTRPTVASTTPESDATSVEVSDPVWVVFSEAMSPSSITNARLTLVSSLATVSTSVHYDETSNTAIIYHANPLEYSTQYTVTVSGMVSDANGNMMGDDYSFSFTTADVLAGTLSWSNPLPQGNILNGVWSISESDIFAVGSVGTIIRSDGTTWTVMNSTTNLELNAVWGASANDVYAVGEGGVIMHFDGTSWLPSYLEPEGSPLWSIWGSSASDVFVGGDDMILHWNGTEWETMILPIEARITSIWGFSANEVYAVAMGQKVLRYDGSEWSVFEEFPGGDTILWSLWGTSASDMYTGGYSTFGDDFLYHYDGTSWSAQDNVNSAIYGIWGSSSDDIYAVGVAGYKMHYNGSTWSDESSHYVDFKSINGTSAGDIYTVGQYGLIEYNNGSTWQIQNGTYIWSLHDVMGFSENNIYAVGIGGTVLQYDGTTWNRLDPLVESRDNYGIGGSAADDIYVVNCRDDGLSFEGGDIYKYDGTNWAAVEEGTDVCFRSVWAVDDGSVFAVGYKEEGNAWVYHSTDSGATWENEELGRMERARSVSRISKQQRYYCRCKWDRGNI